MIKRITILLALLTGMAYAQTHSFPASDTNNTWTGNNTFNASTVFNGLNTFGTVQISSGNPWFDVKTYGAKGNAKLGHSGVTISGSTAFTSGDAIFDCSTDAGKVIQIQDGAGVGSATPVITTIASCQSSTAVTLASPATSTAAGVPFFFGTDDSTAFQAAIDAAVAVQGKVRVPNGTYIATGLLGRAGGPLTPGRATVQIEGSCPAWGSRVMVIGNMVPDPQCSTILDGTNGVTLDIGEGAGYFDISRLTFISFPQSTGEFIYLHGRPDGGAETFNGNINNNAFWGKQYNIYGEHILENILVEKNQSGCAGTANLYYNIDLAAGANKLGVDNNYFDNQGICAGLPSQGIYIYPNGTSASAVHVNYNEVQNFTKNGARAIEVYNCMGCEITGNDIESITGTDSYGIKGSMYGATLGPNTIFNTVHPVWLWGEYNHVLPQTDNRTGIATGAFVTIEGGSGHNIIDCQNSPATPDVSALANDTYCVNGVWHYPSIQGGTFDGVIGGTTPAAGTFTEITGPINGTVGATTPAAGTFTTAHANSATVGPSNNISLNADGSIQAGSWIQSSDYVSATNGFKANGNAGITQVITIRNSAGTGTCTLTVTGGLITATTC